MRPWEEALRAVMSRVREDDGAIDVSDPEDETEHEAAAGDEDAFEPEEEVDVLPPQQKGFYLTPRQTLMAVAGVLALLLLALILYLVWLSLPADFTKKGGEPVAGLIPELTLYGPGRGDQPRFSRPMGASWDPAGERIYVADTENNRIVVFTKRGRYITEFGGHGIAKPLAGSRRTWNPGELNYPTDVAVANNGDVYVADFYNDSISQFTADGKFIRRFPSPYRPTGRGSSGQDGGGIAVTSVAVDRDKVYATDTYQVFVFSRKGKLLEQFGMPGAGPVGLDHPGGIAVDNRGDIYVSDSNHNRVKRYTADGKLVWEAGQQISDLRKETNNPFVLPRGLTVMRDGAILVADPLGQQLVKLDESGKVIADYGARGVEQGALNFPNDVSSQRNKVLLADRGNNRVQVVRLTNR